jgi:hypothetical protein
MANSVGSVSGFRRLADDRRAHIEILWRKRSGRALDDAMLLRDWGFQVAETLCRSGRSFDHLS